METILKKYPELQMRSLANGQLISVWVIMLIVQLQKTKNLKSASDLSRELASNAEKNAEKSLGLHQNQVRLVRKRLKLGMI